MVSLPITLQMSEALISSSYEEAADFKVTRQAIPTSTNKTKDLALQSTFTIPFQKTFSSQYNCIYLQRLRLTRHALAEDIRSIAENEGWADVPICERLVDAIPDTDVVVIGTLYKEMPEKPCVLDELEKDPEAMTNQLSRSNFCSSKDVLYMEDEFGRIPISFIDDENVMAQNSTIPFSTDTLVSGVVVGLFGSLNIAGEFSTSRAFYCGIPLSDDPAAMDDIVPDTTSEFTDKVAGGSPDDQYIAVVSGLQIGRTNAAALGILFDLLSGLAGSTIDQKAISSVSQLIIAGNSIVQPEKAIGYAQRSERLVPGVESARELDMVLTQSASALSTSLMPGESDPAMFLWPQQPFHLCLFPSACSYDSFSRVTNPSWVTHGDQSILLTDGKNINDIVRLSSLSPIDAAESTLRWGCIAPTAPDTLGAYPFRDTDPFVLRSVPDLYIVGAQPEFSRREIVDAKSGKRCAIITLPSFSTTGQFVLVNPKTLHTVIMNLPTFF